MTDPLITPLEARRVLESIPGPGIIGLTEIEALRVLIADYDRLASLRTARVVPGRLPVPGGFRGIGA